MTQRSTFFPLQGGLDQVTQAIAMPAGRCIAVMNHESVAQGYGRVSGYERFDGHPGPTAASEDEADSAARIAAAAASRALIEAVPGSGPVRGVWQFKGLRYAWRDNADASACGMHVESSGGWLPVDTGFVVLFGDGGPSEIIEGDTLTGSTSGATADVVRVIVQSGTWAAGTATGQLILRNVVGTFALENVDQGVMLNVATFAGAPLTQAFEPGGRYSFITHNFYGATDRRCMYGVNGVGNAFEYDSGGLVLIRTGMPVDAPTRLAAYKQQLFLSFPGGSVQHSEVGDPVSWNPILGTGEIGIGDDVTDFIANNQDSLVILGTSSVSVLTGNDDTDFVLSTITDEAGAKPYTAQRVGAAMYLDNRGLRSITATQSYGNFRLGSLTNQIQPTLDGKRSLGIDPVASCTVRTKDQYRLFYADGSGISLYVGRKVPEPMLFALPDIPTCVCSCEDDGMERIFFGAANGFVYEMDVGRSFDGEPIEAYIQLAYNHEGAPRLLKRWHKIILELVAEPDTKISVMGQFDYAAGEQGSTPPVQFDVQGGGGLWDVAVWNTFYWSSPEEGTAECWIDGQGKNLSAIFASVSADQKPYILQGATYNFSIRGQTR